MNHLEINHDTEIIEVKLYTGKLDKYVSTTNLRSFYMELHEILVDNEFLDMIGTPSDIKKGKFFDEQAKRGEFVENKAYLNRVADIFEKKFMWSKKADGTVELEMEWYAKFKTPHSQYGWFETKIYLVCRRIVNKEILVGNTKKVVQQGTWEFRNEFVYKNKIIPEYLNKIPIIKNSHNLKHIYLEHIYEKTIDEDTHFCEHELIQLIQNVIKKYFVNE